MSPRVVELKEGAILIGDAHYSALRPELLDFIKAIHTQKITCTQLILMGDIFDALFGGVANTHEANKEIIQLLNEINEKIELIYLEGNHDFRLDEIFPKAKIFPLVVQPIASLFKDKKVYLAHGDFDVSFVYRTYASIVNNPLTLYILNAINHMTNNLILQKLNEYLAKKDDCKEFIGFEEFVKKRNLQRHGCDYFIEGHFHQNKTIEFKKFKYINLAAFACNQRYFIVKSTEDEILLEEKSFN